MMRPVRPLPALQCTASTLSGSAASHACMSLQQSVMSFKGAGLWSKKRKPATAPPNFAGSYDAPFSPRRS